MPTVDFYKIVLPESMREQPGSNSNLELPLCPRDYNDQL